MVFQCHVCGKEYTKKFNFNYHVAHHFEDRPFVCDFPGCCNSYKTNADLSQHQKTHEKALGITFVCNKCQESFDSSKKLNVHKREMHYTKEANNWCEICCREFTSLSSHHDIVHLKLRPYTCDLDGKRFGKMNGLVRHIQAVHLGLAPFPCQQCDKKFKERSSLKKHLQHHNRVLAYKFRKPPPNVDEWSSDEEIATEQWRKVNRYKCGCCYSDFASKSALLIHETKNHPGAEFFCDLCSLRFASKKKISSHIDNVHFLKTSEMTLTTTYTYKCGACKKIMSSKSALDRHKRIVHLAIYEFLCEHCSAVFRDRSALNKHLKKYHGGKTTETKNIECQSCMKFFFTQTVFDEHETQCRLKKQAEYNQMLDKEKENNFLHPSNLLQKTVKTYSAKRLKAHVTEIKQEPEDTEELLELSNFIVAEDPIDKDPFDITTIIKLEDEVIEIADSGDEGIGTLTNIKTELAQDEVSVESVNFDKPDESSQIEIVIKEESIDIEPIKMMRMVTRIKCKLCTERFVTKEEFTVHFKSQHFSSILSDRTKTLSKEDEIKLEWKNQKLKSPLPGFKAARKLPPLWKESEKNIIKNFVCKHCSQLFNTINDVREHTAKKHKDPVEDNSIKYHCVYCAKKFDLSWQLQQHFIGTHKNQNKIKTEDLPNKIVEEGEEELSGAEPADINEDLLKAMFKGETYNLFAKGFECNFCLKAGKKMFTKLQELKLHCVSEHHIKKIKCNFCNFSFNDQQMFQSHWKQKHDKLKLKFEERSSRRDYPIPNEDIKCPHCSKILSQKESLRRHIELMHNTDRPKVFCDQCTESFIDRRTLQNHILKCHTEQLCVQEKPIVRRRATTQALNCEDCGEVVYGKTGLSVHRWNKHLNIKIIGKKKFHCLICRQVMSCRISALRHHNQVHKSGRLLKRTCRECNAEFQLYEDFKKHIEQHDNVQICLICGESLSSSAELFFHNKTHRNVPEHEKKRFCDLCGFKAQQKITLELHMAKLHNGKKKEYLATCEYCGMTFNCYPAFYAHRKAHSEDKGEKFQCNYCEKTYYSMRNMRDHERSHTNQQEKPYRCEYVGCNKEYVSYNSFQWHTRYTHEENRNQCKVCQEVFTSREKRNVHIDEMHPDVRRYSCRYCGKTFASQSANNRHMQSCEPTTIA